jgi:ribosomal protein L37E
LKNSGFITSGFGYCLAYQCCENPKMSEIAHDVRQEFWRPPQAQPVANSALPEACRRCGTEFMVGAAFCHICGMGRHHSAPNGGSNWAQHLSFLNSLDFGKIKTFFGLPVASLCAFLGGCAFLIIGLAQGLRSAQEFSDFELIQLWRIQWLVAACAAFLAGILLKTRKSET